MALITNNISGSESGNSRIGITGSVVIGNAPQSAFPTLGSDAVFFVSGSETSKSVFGGAAKISGSLSTDGNVTLGNSADDTLNVAGEATFSKSVTATENVVAGIDLKSNFSSGDEGGQIFLNKPVTNTTINTGVTIDVYQDKVRFFENGGTARGYYIDITAGGASASTNLVGGGGGGAPTGAQYVTLATNASLTDERVLTAGTGITLTDGGAGSTITTAIDNSIVATVSGTQFKGNVGVTGSLGASTLTTVSGVLYQANGIVQQDSLFVWDSVSDRLGIGTASPAKSLHIGPNAGASFRLGPNTSYIEVGQANSTTYRWSAGGTATTIEQNINHIFPASNTLGFQSSNGQPSDIGFGRSAAGILNISGSAPGAVLRFNATSTPLAAGDLGMNTTTGRPSAFIGGVVRSLAHTNEIPGTFFNSTTAGSVFTSGSAAFIGSENVDSPTDKGADVFFYVSGSATANNASTSKALFGGDVRVSGTLVVGTGSITITSNDIQLGSSGHVQFGSPASKIALVGSDLTLFDSSNPSGKTLSTLAAGGGGAAIDTGWTASGGSYTQAFSYVSGTVQSFTVPAGVTSVIAYVWGAGGGNGSYANYYGGAGGYAEGTIAVTPGDTLYIAVGGGGLPSNGASGNGGLGGWPNAGFGTRGDASGGGGGGYSGIFSGSSTLQQVNSLLIAGGGGGGTGYQAGGGGGGNNGSDGAGANTGKGGSQGAGGNAGNGDTTPPRAGSALTGGNAGGTGQDDPNTTGINDGGGGGSGYYGGGGGASDGSGGGGGSGYYHPSKVTGGSLIAGNSGQNNATTNPPQTGNTYYVTGIGTGSAPGTKGGDGYVLLVYTTGQLISYTTASVGIGGNALPSDVFFYVSGSATSNNSSTSKALFGGDVRISGSIIVGTGSVVITSNNIQLGSSGHIQFGSSASRLALIGSDLALFDASNPNGKTLSTLAIGGGGSIANYFTSTTAGSIFTSGSTAFAGGEAGIDSPVDKGSNIFFYVSGSISGSGGNDKRALFGGDVVINGSLRQGLSTDARGLYSHAQGNSTIASGLHSHAEGLNASASGEGSHAEGWDTIASGNYSHAEGYSTSASNNYSHAEGETTTASGIGSHAEGHNTTASGQYSHSEGYNTSASNNYSHTEGGGTTASGEYSHAEGIETKAKGLASHAQGESSEAVGDSSFAGGLWTIASGSYQTTLGKYNLRGNTTSLFVIGDGTATGDATRGDILRVNPGPVIGKGKVEITGSIVSTLGLSGSLTTLADGTPYLIAGSNIVLSTGSTGAITISSTGGGGGSPSSGINAPIYFSSTTLGAIFTTGSTAFVGNEFVDAPSGKGTDVFFYVSGSATTNNSSTSKALFGGDVRISGSLTVGTGSIRITSNDIQFDSSVKLEQSGSNLKFYDGYNTSGISLTNLGGLTLIESKYISANTQTVTFSNLDGNRDVLYALFIRRLQGSSSTTQELRPNGTTSNLSAYYHIVTSLGTHAVGSYATQITYGSPIASGSQGLVQVIFTAATGRPRMFNISHVYDTPNAGATVFGFAKNDIVGKWNDTTTNLTSLEIRGNQTDTFVSGSEFHLYKLRRG